MTPAARSERAQRRQERLEQLQPLAFGSDAALLTRVRIYLRTAVDDEALTNSPDEIYRIVKCAPPLNPGEFLIVGGEKNKHRDASQPALRRTDGGWFHFAITGRLVNSSTLELLSYNFEFCFAGKPLQFLRFDLNSPTGIGAPNIEKDLRSHFHPNDERIQVPAAALTPLELLDIFVYGLS